MVSRLRKCGSVLALAVACAVGHAATARAQSTGATTGDIDGRVVDATGAAIAGVSIVAKGSAMVGPVSALSAADGVYLLPLLPPGRYTLTFSRTGFLPTERPGVVVDLGATTTVDARLDVTPITHAVTVIGTGVVDRRSSTLTFALNSGELQQVPGQSFMGSLLALTPGVSMQRADVGGSGGFIAGGYSAYGTVGYNRPTLEGIHVGNLNPFGYVPDYGAFDNVAVGTGAYGPEYPSPGVHVRFVTKSGSNRLSGAVHAGYQHGDWQAHNIDGDQITRGAAGSGTVPPGDANRQLRFHDVNGDAGGPIRPSVLLWYVSARDQSSSVRQLIFDVAPLETEITTLTSKLTWRVSDGHRLTAFVQRGRNRQPIRLDAFTRTASTAINKSIDSTSSQHADGLVWKGEWTAALGASFFVEARAGQFAATREEQPNGSGPRIEDDGNSEVTGGNREWREDWRNNQATGAITYARVGWQGRHLFKAGVEIQRMSNTETWVRAYPDDVLHVKADGVASKVILFQTPSRAEVAQWLYSPYVSDSWQPIERLTLNLGLRFDRLRTLLPAQVHGIGRFNTAVVSFPSVDNLVSWNVFGPRIGTSFDLTGNGRTFVKANYALYRLPHGLDVAWDVNPNARVWWERFSWSDLDGDGVWQSGEEFDREATSPADISETIDPGLRLPHVHEVTGRFEREAALGLYLETGLVWRGERRHSGRQRAAWPISAFDVPQPRADPGPDNKAGTPDDGPSIPLFELRPELLGETAMVLTNPPHTASDHLTWEAVIRRRLSGRWSVVASVAHTWNLDQARAYGGQAVRANEFPLTPNDFVQTDARGRHVYRDWSVKAYGTWLGPWGLAVTPLLRHQSGQAFGRTIRAELNYGIIRVLAEPVGTRRQDNITLVDVRFDKAVRLGGSRHVTFFADVFNALNANSEQNVVWETGPRFLRPQTIVPPRILRLGFRLDY